MSEHLDHAGHGKRGSPVDALDATLRDRARNDKAESEIRDIEFRAYFAWPVTLAGPSTREIGFPIAFVLMMVMMAA